MRENIIEQTLTREVSKTGALALKFVTPTMTGVPDRIILTPGGRVIFVEVKAPGKKPRPIQIRRHNQLRDLGYEVHVIDSITQAKELARALHAA